MFSCRLTIFSLLGAALLVACSGDDDDGNGLPCDTDPIPAECGESCNAGNPCATGFYCGEDGACTADCTPSGDQCEDGEECDETGHCVPGGSDDDSDDMSTDDDSDDSGDDDCPAVEVSLNPIVPDVVLLLDQS